MMRYAPQTVGVLRTILDGLDPEAAHVPARPVGPWRPCTLPLPSSYNAAQSPFVRTKKYVPWRQAPLVLELSRIVTLIQSDQLATRSNAYWPPIMRP